MQYDEATGEWVPKWGYKGANKGVENDWIVEVDEKKERERKAAAAARKRNSKSKTVGEEDGSVRGDSRRERVERIKRGERKMRANERRAEKTGRS
jgi:regulator of ribosome biosynthesis